MFILLHTGVGYSIQIIFITLMMYYLTPATWAVIYLSDSLASSPPWTTCDNPWNSLSCEAFNYTATWTCTRDSNITTTTTSTTTPIPLLTDNGTKISFTSSTSEYLR